METLLLIASIALLLLAIKSHMLSQAYVIKKVERVWYERLFTGSRPTKDNLTEEGLKYRKQSNIYAISGFISVGLYVLVSSAK